MFGTVYVQKYLITIKCTAAWGGFLTNILSKYNFKTLRFWPKLGCMHSFILHSSESRENTRELTKYWGSTKHKEIKLFIRDKIEKKKTSHATVPVSGRSKAWWWRRRWSSRWPLRRRLKGKAWMHLTCLHFCSYKRTIFLRMGKGVRVPKIN